MIFSSIFLHAVVFSHVLHLDVLRRQIELKLKAKIEISLCMAIMQNHPLLPYCVIIVCCRHIIINQLRTTKQNTLDRKIYFRETQNYVGSIIIGSRAHALASPYRSPSGVGNCNNIVLQKRNRVIFSWRIYVIVL